MAAVIAPAGDSRRTNTPRGGATLCLLGHNRALAAFPNSDPRSLSWSPDGRYLTVVSGNLSYVRP